MFILAIIFSILYGIYKLIDKSNSTVKDVIVFLLLLCGSVAIYCGLESYHEITIIIGLTLIAILIAFVTIFYIIESKEVEKQEQEKEKKFKATMLDRFFVECVLAEVNDFSKEKNIQRAKLLAKNYQLSYPNGIEALYQQGYDAHIEISKSFKEERLERIRKEEQIEYENLIQYSDFSGRDKRIAMLSDIANKLMEEAAKADKLSTAVMSIGQEKERDWATLGGIANGLGGVGAGVSTAIDIQNKNMQIRANNKARRQQAAPASFLFFSEACDKKKEAQEIIKKIKDAEQKLISYESPTDLIKKLTFQETKITISETGSATIRTKVSLKEKHIIFDDVPAVIDGTIIAKIYDEDKLCGKAKLVLPIDGLSDYEFLRGICLNCCEQGKDYKIKFAAKNLWAMEK